MTQVKTHECPLDAERVNENRRRHNGFVVEIIFHYACIQEWISTNHCDNKEDLDHVFDVETSLQD